MQDAHEVGAWGKDGIAAPRAPACEGQAVVLEELDELAEHLDSAPLVAACDARIEAAKRGRSSRADRKSVV